MISHSVYNDNYKKIHIYFLYLFKNLLDVVNERSFLLDDSLSKVFIDQTFFKSNFFLPGICVYCVQP